MEMEKGHSGHSCLCSCWTFFSIFSTKKRSVSHRHLGAGSVTFSSPQAEAEAARAQMLEATGGRDFRRGKLDWEVDPTWGSAMWSGTPADWMEHGITQVWTSWALQPASMIVRELCFFSTLKCAFGANTW